MTNGFNKLERKILTEWEESLGTLASKLEKSTNKLFPTAEWKIVGYDVTKDGKDWYGSIIFERYVEKA